VDSNSLYFSDKSEDLKSLMNVNAPKLSFFNVLYLFKFVDNEFKFCPEYNEITINNKTHVEYLCKKLSENVYRLEKRATDSDDYDWKSQSRQKLCTDNIVINGDVEITHATLTFTDMEEFKNIINAFKILLKPFFLSKQK
jgi:hypothetical protein